MFSNLLKLIVPQSHTPYLQLLRTNTALAGQIKTRPKEIQNVRLSGTIYREPISLENGIKVILIKTVRDNFYTLHRALIWSTKILNLVGNDLSVGQRVFLSGQLAITPFKVADGKFRQLININVDELYASKTIEETNDGNANTSVLDCNDVMMLAHISSDILRFEHYCSFALSIHTTPRNSTEEIINFVRVNVHNANLNKLVQNQFKKGDRVIVRGALSSRPEVDINGKKKQSAHIDALSVMKVDRFSDSKHQEVSELDVN